MTNIHLKSVVFANILKPITVLKPTTVLKPGLGSSKWVGDMVEDKILKPTPDLKTALGSSKWVKNMVEDTTLIWRALCWSRANEILDVRCDMSERIDFPLV